MPIISGKLRHRVTIQSPVTVSGEYGGTYETWFPYSGQEASEWEEGTNSEDAVEYEVGDIVYDPADNDKYYICTKDHEAYDGEKPLAENSYWKEIDKDDFNKAFAWASVDPVRGREYWDARQAQSEVEGKIIMRYRNNVTPDKRILFQGRPLEILAILNPQERKEQLEILYKEWQ